jgi:hypothetical protein
MSPKNRLEKDVAEEEIITYYLNTGGIFATLSRYLIMILSAVVWNVIGHVGLKA